MFTLMSIYLFMVNPFCLPIFSKFSGEPDLQSIIDKSLIPSTNRSVFIDKSTIRLLI